MRIVLCQCKAAGLIPEAIYRAVRQSLENSQRQVVCIDDLCALAARKDDRLARWVQEPLTVVACYERAVRALFSYAGQTLSESAAVLNLRAAGSADEIICRMPTALSGPASSETVEAAEADWPAWFPVIDYSRCKNCKQCLNFCLFGVYAQTEDKKVRVARPQSCKNGCPACARVCPDAAIIFPKYDKSPINGDAVDESAWRVSQADSAQSLKHRLSGSVFQHLRNRRSGSAEKSIHDLKALKEQLDIPDRLFDPDNLDSSPKRDS
jgi:Pyruvate/2-oxoacid:ferredoxin oxidoreductase delta subunit